MNKALLKWLLIGGAVIAAGYGAWRYLKRKKG